MLDRNPPLARAFKQHPLLQARQFVQRHITRQTRGRAEGLEHRPAERLGQIGPEVEGSVKQRQRRVPHQCLMLNPRPGAEPVADHAPAQRTVEGKLSRLQRPKTLAALGTGQEPAVDLDRPVGLGQRIAVAVIDRPGDQHGATARLKGGLNTLGNPAAFTRLGRDPVDHDLQPVFAFAIKRWVFIDPVRGAINPQPHKAGRLEPGQKTLRRLADLQLHRGKHQQPAALGHTQDAVNRFIDRLPAQRHPAVGAVHDAQPGGQHPEEVVHLGQRADRRSWGAAG